MAVSVFFGRHLIINLIPLILFLGRPENYYGPDDRPVEVPDFSTYRIILRCILKLKGSMIAIFKNMDIRIVREGCIKNARTSDGPWLSKQFINAISLVEAADELFDVLMYNQHFDWINFSVLESMVEHSKSEIAQKVLGSYKKYTLQLTFLTVFTLNTKVSGIEEPGPGYTKIKEVLAVDVSKMTVGELLEHKAFLEKNIFGINKDSTRVGAIEIFEWEVVWIIPTECSYHAYHHANNNLHKFDTIVSLEIEDYPIIRGSVQFPVDLLNCEFMY